MAFYTLAERKLLSSFQRRLGPNVVGFFGLLQPFADGLKLLIKEIVFPYKANKFLFIFAPTFILILSLIT
jgi:NADH:ubiquinone oxidoreductase subunit H